jgi:hypothetical protein
MYAELGASRSSVFVLTANCLFVKPITVMPLQVLTANSLFVKPITVMPLQVLTANSLFVKPITVMPLQFTRRSYSVESNNLQHFWVVKECLRIGC